jgi:hypothetical protein
MVTRLSSPLAALLWLLGIAVNHAGAQEARKDLHGDPLPPAAIARLGTVRWRPGWQCAALAYTPDGTALLSVDAINGCCVWDLASGKKLRQFGPEPDRGNLTAGAFSADASLVAIGRYRSLGVWDTKTGKPLWRGVLSSHQESGVADLASVAFSADGSTLAWRDWPFTDVELCDAKTGKLLAKLPGPSYSFGRPFFEAGLRPQSERRTVLSCAGIFARWHVGCCRGRGRGLLLVRPWQEKAATCLARNCA